MGLFGSSSPFDPLLEKATAESNTSEDWSLILHICDKARSSAKNGKDCLTSIIKRLNHRVPRVGLQALVVLDACVSNSGREFQKLVSSQDFINELRPLVSRNDQVGEKIRGLIKKWSKEFEDEAELSLIVSFYHYLRSAGAHFPDETAKSTTRRPVNTNPDAVDSQQEADDIALAIQRSLAEEQKAKEATTKPVETPSLYYSTLQTADSSSSSNKKLVKALYDFEAAEDNELTFKTGDIITIIEQSDANWWEGELNGKTGLFPSNFVEETTAPTANGHATGHDSQAAQESKIVVKVNAELLDSTLLAVESADPAEEVDPDEMIKNEEICKQMGAIIDAKLSEMDTEQIKYTQLNEKLLQCLQLYDTLMTQEQQYQHSYMQQQMGAMAFQDQQYAPPVPNMYAPQTMAPPHSVPQQMPQQQQQQMTHQAPPPPQAHQAQPPSTHQPNPAQTHSQQQPPPPVYQVHPHNGPMGQFDANYQVQNVTQAPPQQQPPPPPSSATSLPPPQYATPPHDPQSYGAVYEPTAPPPTPPVTQQQYLG